MSGTVIFEHTEIPASMAPVNAMESMLVLELGCGTLESTLIKRWESLASPEWCDNLQVSAAFFPSNALLARLRGISGAFRIVSTDGRTLAHRVSSGPETVLEADPDSFELCFPWDLLRVNETILGSFKENRILGTVREFAVLDGTVILGEGSVILPGVYIEGTAVIGKNCKIGPNAYLRGCTFLGDGCHVGQAVEIKNSILMHGVSAGHLTYLGDSVVCPSVNFGGGTIASNFRHDGKNHRSMVGTELVDTGRRKFGTVIGPGVHTGIHTSIYPGRKIDAGLSTRPGDVVQRDLHQPEGI